METCISTDYGVTLHQLVKLIFTEESSSHNMARISEIIHSILDTIHSNKTTTTTLIKKKQVRFESADTRVVADVSIN